MPYSEHRLAELTLLHSFFIPRDKSIFDNFIAGGSIGVYVNDPDNLIFLGLFAFHWLYDDRLLTVDYDAIQTVEVGECEDVLGLVLSFENDEFIFLPVFNETEEVSDVYAMREFFVSAVYWPHYSWNTEEIANIETPQDVADFLNQQEEGWHRFSTGQALAQDFPSPRILKAFNIDQNILKNPDVCRLLALFLCHDFEERWDANQAEFFRFKRSARERFVAHRGYSNRKIIPF